MRNPARILVADDTPANVRMLETRLTRDGYDVVVARDGEEALAVGARAQPDLILLDIMMPKIDGIEVCRRLKSDAAFPFTPIIMVTALADAKDVVAGFEPGGDDYLTKPVDAPALSARVRSMLRIKSLHDTVQEQAAELERWNATLEERVRQQVAELERIGRLKRFFSPQLAELIVQGGAADPLQSHRREVTVVFLDLRGFTAFAEVAEPEEVMAVLREYHALMGELILAHEGTLERFTGDGMMVFFNDPVPVPNPAERALRMTLEMRSRAEELAARMAQARLRAARGHRRRARLRHHRRHRLRRPLGLRRHRHGDQSCGASLRRGAGRPDPHQPARARGDRRAGRDRAGGRAHPQRFPASDAGLPRPAAAPMTKIVRIDRTKRLREEPHKGHNRWHPDIAPVIEVERRARR